MPDVATQHEARSSSAHDWPTWPPPIDDAQRDAVLRVLESRRWGSHAGDECERFAQEFADHHGVRHGVPVVNGTVALFVALRALGIGPGDEVIMPSYTFIACPTATLLTGAIPVICDVSSEHLHMTAETIREAISERTKAIMVVHIAGSPAPMDEIRELAREHGLRIVEDSAQAHGAHYRDTPVGGLGDISTFSFQSSKAMTAGEGGLMLTDDDILAEKMWSITNVGRSRGGAWYAHDELGWNLRLTELQAAILRPWLPRLEGEIAQRERFVTELQQQLDGHGLPVSIVDDPEGTTRNSRHLLVLRLAAGADREWIASALEAAGLPVDLGYPALASFGSIRDKVIARPTPRLDTVRDRLLWIRQAQMMAGADGVPHTTRALGAVLRDERAFPHQ